MDLYARQQFDFLLHTAVERFAERLQQRNEGGERALELLRTDSNGEGVWRDQFVDAVFQDFLLDNVEGACFVLQALAREPIDDFPAGRVGDTLMRVAKAAFAALLERKTAEALERCLAAGTPTGGGH